jgi:hypothetical protein
MKWTPLDTAPFCRDLELAVIDSKGMHLVAFPCRRLADSGWTDLETNKQGASITYAPRIGEIGCLTSPDVRLPI